MLKIKDNVDLKELEKFGFNLLNYDNQTVYHKRIEKNKICLDYYVINNYVCLKIQGTLDEALLDDTLYDLIKADLVEKVDE